MTNVDFYTLAAQTQNEQWQFACRLVEKAAQRGHHILIQLDHEQQAKMFDDLLWEFRQDAFIPHQLLSASDSERISIGWNDNPGHQHDILINLSQQMPPFYSRFHRLIEVVVQEDNVLNYTRKHYKFLLDRGYPIQHTDMRMR